MVDSNLVNEELERVFTLYSAQLRQFRRALYGLIVASLTLFILIVVPFLTFRDQLAALRVTEQDLAVELLEAHDSLNNANADLETFEGIEGIRTRFSIFAELYRTPETYQSLAKEAGEHEAELEELKREFAGSGDIGIQAWLRGETKQLPEEFTRHNRSLWNLTKAPCFWERGTKHAACRLCNTFTDKNRSVSGTISRLSTVTEEDRAATGNDLAAVVERACGWLTQDVEHWKMGGQFDPNDVASVRGFLTHDLHAYEERLDTLYRVVRRSVLEREIEIERKESNLDSTAERLGVLEKQLNRIASFDRLSTPIGDLPVGLGQIVLLFPVIVALGFIVIANGYARTAGLQRAFVRLCHKRDQTGEVMDDLHISVIAPLWLEPRESLGARAVRWVIILAPLMLVLANLTLIATTRALTEQLPDDAAISPPVYLALYAASLAFLVGALWHIRQVGNKPPEQTASSGPEPEGA